MFTHSSGLEADSSGIKSNTFANNGKRLLVLLATLVMNFKEFCWLAGTGSDAEEGVLDDKAYIISVTYIPCSFLLPMLHRER